MDVCAVAGVDGLQISAVANRESVAMRRL